MEQIKTSSLVSSSMTSAPHSLFTVAQSSALGHNAANAPSRNSVNAEGTAEGNYFRHLAFTVRRCMAQAASNAAAHMARRLQKESLAWK